MCLNQDQDNDDATSTGRTDIVYCNRSMDKNNWDRANHGAAGIGRGGQTPARATPCGEGF